jgi:hypothetical protein
MPVTATCRSRTSDGARQESPPVMCFITALQRRDANSQAPGKYARDGSRPCRKRREPCSRQSRRT